MRKHYFQETGLKQIKHTEPVHKVLPLLLVPKILKVSSTELTIYIVVSTGTFYNIHVIKLTAFRLSTLSLLAQFGPSASNLVHMEYTRNTCCCRSCSAPDTWWGKVAARLTPGLLDPTYVFTLRHDHRLNMSFSLTYNPQTSSDLFHFAPNTVALCISPTTHFLIHGPLS
jgi:hypothetical protein